MLERIGRALRHARAGPGGPKTVRAALRGKVNRLVFVDDRRLRLMRRFARPFTLLTGWDVNRTVKLLIPLHALLKGVPTDTSLTSTYWRKKAATSSVSSIRTVTAVG